VQHLRIEGAFRGSVWAELPAYRVADGATDALLWVLNHARVEGGEGEPPPDYFRKRALAYLAVMTLREARAILALTACGWEAETTPHARTVIEAFGRAQSVERDESGSYAKAWLEGKAGTPAREFSKQKAEDLWKLMSHSSHADHRSVENMYAVTDDDGSASLLVMPERRPKVSGAILALTAGHIRDVARIVATAFALQIPDLAQLDVAIKQLRLFDDSVIADETATTDD
jgi:hypothetical protein